MQLITPIFPECNGCGVSMTNTPYHKDYEGNLCSSCGSRRLDKEQKRYEKDILDKLPSWALQHRNRR